MKRLRARLTFANVVSCIALFIALGGASYAAFRLPRNSVGPRQLRRNAVTTAKIRNRAVTGAKLRLKTIGTVPSAATLEGQTAAQISASSVAASKLQCPQGTAPFAGLCFETTSRSPTALGFAEFDCADVGRWLPSISQLIAYEESAYTSPPPQEWTDSLTFSGTEAWGYVANGYKNGAGHGAKKASENFPFRCVIAPTN